MTSEVAAASGVVSGVRTKIGRPRTRTLEEERAYEARWLREYKAKQRASGKLPKLLHPEIVNRRKQRGGRKTAELIRTGKYHLPVPGMGWKTSLKETE